MIRWLIVGAVLVTALAILSSWSSNDGCPSGSSRLDTSMQVLCVTPGGATVRVLHDYFH